MQASALEAPSRVSLLVGGAQAFPRMLAAIAAARRSIDLQVYLFRHDGIGARFIVALEAAAARGVRVRVTLDGWGSSHDGNAIVRELRAAGCEARIFNRLLTLLLCRLGRNHRKVLLVDDERAFIGGLNIGDEYAGEAWLDLAAEVSGACCAQLGRALRQGGRTDERGPIRVYLSGLWGGGRLRRRYLKAIRRARQSIVLAQGYFLPDAQLLRALGRAARRGVRVSALLAGTSDVPFAPLATRLLYARLVAAGVEVHEWTSSLLHAKAMVVDGRKLLVGSFNLDPLSLAMMEILVEASDLRAASEAGAWMASLLLRARRIDAGAASVAGVAGWVPFAVGRLFAIAGGWLAGLILRRRRKRPRASAPRTQGVRGASRARTICARGRP